MQSVGVSCKTSSRKTPVNDANILEYFISTYRHPFFCSDLTQAIEGSVYFARNYSEI